MKQKKTPASQIALGGVLAALAVVIMSFGGMIPIATYVSPMICMLLLQQVSLACGNRIAWAWFGAVAFLSILLSPDKEAAGVFLFLGYYPIVKPVLDIRKTGWILKALLFNVSICVLYFLLIQILGTAELGLEAEGFGKWMLAAMLLLGNLIFFLVDRLLGMPKFGKKR